MRRYQYRLNDQNVSQAGWGNLTPLKYIEAIPGETYGGTITVKARSALTDKVIHSRAYYDLYAFYCPIRLLWPDFPKLLASSELEPSEAIDIPKTTTLFPQNFEHSFMGSDAAWQDNLTTGTNAAFLRRMYYMTYYSFFAVDRRGQHREAQQYVELVRKGGMDQSNWIGACAARESTLDESWYPVHDGPEKTIATDSEGNINLDQIRRAYSLDRFEKMLDYYGSRYTDILQSYGVKADWGILQEPECIGMNNNDFRFVKKSSTGDEAYGEERGYFEGEYKLKLRKTFCPEHGIIAVFAVPRADTFNETYAGHLLGTRDIASPALFYDPVAWSGYNNQTGPKRLVDYTADRGARVDIPLGEHLRKGRNEHALPAGAEWGSVPVFSRSDMGEHLDTPDDWRQAICRPMAEDVRVVDGDQKINVPPANISHYTEVRVAKRSPLPPSKRLTQR